jgi:hypothetical protein
MTPWQRLVGDRPIVTRLVVAVAAAMTVVLVLASAFVYWRVSFALGRQLNQDLDAYQEVVERAVRTGQAPPEDTPGETYQVYDARGRLVGGDREIPALLDRTDVAAGRVPAGRFDVGRFLPGAGVQGRGVTSAFATRRARCRCRHQSAQARRGAA